MRARAARARSRRRRQRGQSTAEYVILCGLLVAGLAFTFGMFPAYISHFCFNIFVILGLPVI